MLNYSSTTTVLQEPGTVTLPYVPTPAQEPFSRSRARYKLAGGKMGGGKALALDTLLPTPSGWTTMGEVQVGDWLLDERGCPCQVRAISPVMHDHTVYEVVFKDGSTIVADADHRWLTETVLSRASASRQRTTPRKGGKYAYDQSDKIIGPAVRTTQEIKDTLRYGARGNFNHSVAVAAPLQLPAADLPIDPYILGAWLGDGIAQNAGFTTADVEMLAAFESAGYVVTKRADRYTYGILGLQAQLRALGLVNNKYIPPIYLRGSVAQRLALLQGLMDTDGTCLPSGQCEFYSCNLILADAVRELLLTLGVKCRIREGRATIDGRDCGPKYRIKFMASFSAFRLTRKAARQKVPQRGTQDVRMIVDVREHESVPVKCVGVDSPSHLYLAGEAMIPTHNTYMLAGEALELLVMHPGNVGFMGRLDLQDLIRTTLKEFLAMIPPELLIEHHHTERKITVETIDPNHPSILYYGDLKDPNSVLSLNLGFFVIDEAFEVPKVSFDALASRLRLRLPDGTYPPYTGMLSSNPAPCWLMDTFPVTEEQQAAVRAGLWPKPQYAYFPFGMDSNPHVAPGYVREMQDLFRDDEVAYARYVEGRWDNRMQGLIYPLEPYHRWKAPVPGARLWNPQQPVELAGDPSGGAAPYGVLVIQQQGNRVCLVDEFYEEGATDEDVHEWLRAKPYRTKVADGIFDPAAKTSIERLQRLGWPVRGLTHKKDIAGHIATVKGIMRVDQATGYAPLLIDENHCPHILGEFGLYSYKKVKEADYKQGVRPPETPEDKNNHLINALEYWTREKKPLADGTVFYRKPPTKRRAAYLRWA